MIGREYDSQGTDGMNVSVRRALYPSVQVALNCLMCILLSSESTNQQHVYMYTFFVLVSVTIYIYVCIGKMR